MHGRGHSRNAGPRLCCRCDEYPELGECTFYAGIVASWLYYLECFILFFYLVAARDTYSLKFAPPPPKPRVEVLREQAQAFEPLPPEALQAQQIQLAMRQLEVEEEAALYEFESAMITDVLAGQLHGELGGLLVSVCELSWQCADRGCLAGGPLQQVLASSPSRDPGPGLLVVLLEGYCWRGQGYCGTLTWGACARGVNPPFLVFVSAPRPACSGPVRQNEAHRQWQEVVKKLELLKEDPEQYLQQAEAPSETV